MKLCTDYVPIKSIHIESIYHEVILYRDAKWLGVIGTIYWMNFMTIDTYTHIHLHLSERELKSEQECIPVGCVPPAHWPYLPACSARGGVPGLGGSAWSGGKCLVRGSARGCLLRGGWYPSMHWGRHPLWRESHTRVKTWPSPNFVAGGKNDFDYCHYCSVNSTMNVLRINQTVNWLLHCGSLRVNTT